MPGKDDAVLRCDDVQPAADRDTQLGDMNHARIFVEQPNGLIDLLAVPISFGIRPRPLATGASAIVRKKPEHFLRLETMSIQKGTKITGLRLDRQKTERRMK
ncbi:hypothetical protein ACN28I_15265 [Archangium gephyra]|uniref:hypothetical protein n=1 Tax=Archangium gephyra TaxID=48 RepID=UPI003B7B78EC